ncbi:MAG TPA: hypothetical protein VEZ44_04000 [bacterium]|nr:hypothetical protein [bacterium]
MERDTSALAWTRALLTLPTETGRDFDDELEAIRRRIKAVHDAPVTHDTEPAGAPRLRRDDG